jgi:hypothetical protein
MYNGISEFVHRKPFELDNFQMRWRRRFADSVFRLSSFFFSVSRSLQDSFHPIARRHKRHAVITYVNGG